MGARPLRARGGAGITAISTRFAPRRVARSTRSGLTARTRSARVATRRSKRSPTARVSRPPTVRLCSVTTNRARPERRRPRARAARAPARRPWAWTTSARRPRRRSLATAAGSPGLGLGPISRGSPRAPPRSTPSITAAGASTMTSWPACTNSRAQSPRCARTPPAAEPETSRTRRRRPRPPESLASTVPEGPGASSAGLRPSGLMV